jgi:DNA-binding NarL/FixJ family response regulator
MTTVAFVEDNEAYRRFLETIVGASRRYQVVGSFESVRAAAAGLAEHPVDIVLVDIQLRGHSGITAVTRLRERWPRTRCVMLTNSEDAVDLFAALEAGASGYLLKSDSREQILAALDETVAGGAPLSRTVARRVVGSFASPAKPVPAAPTVTRREREIMDHLARGFTYKEIGRSLGISIATVKNHLSRIYDKLRVRSRTEAVVKWLKR